MVVLLIYFLCLNLAQLKLSGVIHRSALFQGVLGMRTELLALRFVLQNPATFYDLLFTLILEKLAFLLFPIAH